MPARPPRGQTSTSIATRGPQSLGGLQRRPPDATALGGRQRLTQQLRQTEEQAPSEGWSSVGSSRQGPDLGTQRLSVHEGAPNPGLPRSPPPPSAQSTSARLLQAGRGYRAASGQRKDEGPGHNHPSLGALRPQQGPEPAGTSGLQGRVAQGGAVGLSRAVGSVQGAPRRSFPSTPEPKQQLPPSLPHAGQSRAGALTPRSGRRD